MIRGGSGASPTLLATESAIRRATKMVRVMMMVALVLTLPMKKKKKKKKKKKWKK